MYSNHHLNYFDNLNDTELLEGELSIPDDDYKLKEMSDTIYKLNN